MLVIIHRCGAPLLVLMMLLLCLGRHQCHPPRLVAAAVVAAFDANIPATLSLPQLQRMTAASSSVDPLLACRRAPTLLPCLQQHQYIASLSSCRRLLGEETYNSRELYNRLQLFSQYFLVTVNTCCCHLFLLWFLFDRHIKTAEQRTIIQQYGNLYTDR